MIILDTLSMITLDIHVRSWEVFNIHIYLSTKVHYPLPLHPHRHLPLKAMPNVRSRASSNVRYTSVIQDKRLWTKRIFYDELLQSKLMYKEVRAKILLDQKRPYRSSAFDGKMVVIGVESGAHIFTF